MNQSLIDSGRFLAAIGLSFFLGAITSHAAPMNVKVEGTVPLTGSANDFHIKVAVTPPFLVGQPINFQNGPFAGDGTTTSSSTGFTVDWAGALVTGGGPHTFGFEFLTNMPFDITEAWWTINGNQVSQNLEGLVTDRQIPIPEPSSLLLLLLGLGGVLLRPQQNGTARNNIVSNAGMA